MTKILNHLGEKVEAPKMRLARAPPEEYQIEQEFGCDPELEYHYDQSVSW